jgi:hypothetical protein
MSDGFAVKLGGGGRAIFSRGRGLLPLGQPKRHGNGELVNEIFCFQINSRVQQNNPGQSVTKILVFSTRVKKSISLGWK